MVTDNATVERRGADCKATKTETIAVGGRITVKDTRTAPGIPYQAKVFTQTSDLNG